MCGFKTLKKCLENINKIIGGNLRGKKREPGEATSFTLPKSVTSFL